MVENIKVSVIIPVYNTGKYLRECMESVLKQTLHEIEVICVDDGSTDGSMDILREYADQDSRIKIFCQKNGGTGQARNTGIQQATGEYIAFVDSDDYVDLDMCERAFNVAKSGNADIVVYGGSTFPTDVQWANRRVSIRSCEYHNDSMNALVYENGSYPFIWNKLYRREIIVNNNLLFPSIPIGQDHAWLFVVFPRAEHIIYIPDRFYHYRQNREGSTMVKFSTDKVLKLEQHKKIVEFVYDEWHKSGDFTEYGHYWAHWCLTFFGRDIVNTIYAQARNMAPWIVERAKPFKSLLQEDSRNIFEELQFLVNDPGSFYEERFKTTEKKLRDNDTKLKNTERKLKDTEAKLKTISIMQKDTGKKLNASLSREKALKNSVSFRAGRAITWGPRKVRGGARCYKQHGASYTIKRLGWHITHLK